MSPRRLILAAALLAAFALAPTAGAGSPRLSLSAPAAFSPNGDGVLDRAQLEVTLGTAAALTVEVRRATGEPAAALAFALPVAAGPTRLAWDGTLDTGGPAADGTYTVVARADDGAGGVAELAATVRLDTAPPRLALLSLSQQPGAGPLRTAFRARDAGAALAVTLRLSDRAGRRWRAGSVHARPGSRALLWRLRGPGGGRLAPGAYRASLRVADDAGNEAESAARPVLVAYPVTTRVYRRVEGAGRLVALTFDDCNEPAAWRRILSLLAVRDVRASFFCLGGNVAAYPALARRTLRAGHSIGNHTWSHRYLPALSRAGVRGEVERVTALWWRLARSSPLPWFRPPYGALGPAIAGGSGDAGYRRTVLWDVDPQDWRRPGAAAIAARAVGPARGGSIILLHVQAQTADALPSILRGLAARGLEPVTLDRLFAAGGIR